jgi:two-component system sensor histidine kinase EvgS
LQRVDGAEQPKPLPETSMPDPRLNVLVIDDHPANLLLMAQQLATWAWSQPAPAMVAKAWRMARRRFDVLVLDCNMPHMNGYQLATAVRAEERQGKRPRCTILGYTANAQPEVRRSA